MNILLLFTNITPRSIVYYQGNFRLISFHLSLGGRGIQQTGGIWSTMFKAMDMDMGWMIDRNGRGIRVHGRSRRRELVSTIFLVKRMGMGSPI
jgi:hypothetical protein